MYTELTITYIEGRMQNATAKTFLCLSAAIAPVHKCFSKKRFKTSANMSPLFLPVIGMFVHICSS